MGYDINPRKKTILFDMILSNDLILFCFIDPKNSIAHTCLNAYTQEKLCWNVNMIINELKIHLKEMATLKNDQN